jgi:hypothetical protein
MTQVVVDAQELIRRAVTYIVEGLVVAIAAFALPKKKLELEEVERMILTMYKFI